MAGRRLEEHVSHVGLAVEIDHEVEGQFEVHRDAVRLAREEDVIIIYHVIQKWRIDNKARVASVQDITIVIQIRCHLLDRVGGLSSILPTSRIHRQTHASE